MGKGISERNLSEIEEGHWYLSKFVPHGGECVSCPKMSAKELAVLDAFEGAVKGTIGTAGESLLKSVTANVHDVGSLSHAMVQRARDHVKQLSGVEDEKSYRNLPALCYEILKLNPGSRIVCQADTEGRFYRAFVMLKMSVQGVMQGCLPCIEVDGTFMKHPSYNGTCLVAVGKTGDLKNVPLAIAMVPWEQVDHFSWVFYEFDGGWNKLR